MLGLYLDVVGLHDLDVTFPWCGKERKKHLWPSLLYFSPKVFITLGIHGIVMDLCGWLV